MLQKFYNWYGKKTVWIVLVAIVTLVVIAIVFTALKKDTSEESLTIVPTVKTAIVSEITSPNSINLIGTVRSVNEAQIQTEAAGRVTSVRVSLGDTVSAGSVVATLENAAQQASVLQAEGSYEAALASAKQSTVSVSSAENAVLSAEDNLINSYQSAFNTVNDVLLTTIDDFFANPNSQIPGLRLDGKGYTSTLNAERKAFITIINDWQSSSVSVSGNSNLSSLSATAQADVNRMISMIDIFLKIINDQPAGTTISGVAVESYNATLLADRASLNAVKLSLQTNLSALVAAEENLEKAKLSGSTAESSVSSAQVKQALGSLRAAQANLSKTILRTPIAGTVNSLNIRTGDYVTAFTNAVKIANNNALEISAFAGEKDVTRFKIGDIVTIEGQYEGIITKIAAGIDSATQKTEIKVATETDKLTNGDTVSITVKSDNAEVDNQLILLPLTAIKFSSTDGAVFTIDDGVLAPHPVSLGAVRGSNVEVLSGVTTDMEIVVDARGLSAGAKAESLK